MDFYIVSSRTVKAMQRYPVWGKKANIYKEKLQSYFSLRLQLCSNYLKQNSVTKRLKLKLTLEKPEMTFKLLTNQKVVFYSTAMHNCITQPCQSGRKTYQLKQKKRTQEYSFLTRHYQEGLVFFIEFKNNSPLGLGTPAAEQRRQECEPVCSWQGPDAVLCCLVVCFKEYFCLKYYCRSFESSRPA